MQEPGGGPEDSAEKTGLTGRVAALRETLIGAFGVMMVAVTVASALNYLFSVLMSHMLNAEGAFSSFNSLNSIFLIVTLGALSVQTVITKYIAEFEVLGEKNKIRLLLKKFSWWLVLLGGAILLISVAAAWPLASALHLSSPAFVVLLGVSVGITLYLTLPYGVLQGMQRFLALGLAAISVASLRIVFGYVLVKIGFGVYGALAAATLAGLLVTAIVLYFYRSLFQGKPEPDETFHTASALWAIVPVAVAVFLVIFMTQIDVVIVKAVKGAVVADVYSKAALAGKAVLFFPEGVTLVMFPKVSAMREQGEPTQRILWLSLAAAGALVAVVVAFYAVFPGFTASFFAGKDAKVVTGIAAPAGINFVVLFGLVMAIFALIKLLAFYHLALERKAFIAIYAVGAVAEVVGILLYHRTLPQVLIVMLIVGATLLLVSLAFAAKEKPAKAGYSLAGEVPNT